MKRLNEVLKALDACSVPPAVRNARTLQQAWQRASRCHRRWVADALDYERPMCDMSASPNKCPGCRWNPRKPPKALREAYLKLARRHA